MTTCRVPGCSNEASCRFSAARFCDGHIARTPPVFLDEWSKATSQQDLERTWVRLEDEFVFEEQRRTP